MAFLRVFYIFHLGKLLLAHCHSCILDFLSNLGFYKINLVNLEKIVFRLFGAYQLISLLNLPNSATTILYHSSRRYVFRLCDNIMACFSLSLIAACVHCLIFV